MFINDKILSYYLSDKKGIYFFPNRFARQIKSGIFDDVFYKKKYELLKKNGVFNKKEILLDGLYSGPIIRRALTNTIAIDFELTENCNLDCEYCIFGKFYEQIPGRKNKSINLNYAFKLIDYTFNLFNDPNENFSLGKPIYLGFYGGEPLLEFKKLVEIINYAKSKKLNYNFLRYSMTTNGTLIHKYIDYLVEHEFKLSISLDGNKNHNYLRKYKNKKECYDDVFNNINLIKRKYPAYFKENVSFNTVRHSKNPVNEVEKYFSENFNKRPIFSLLNQNRINKNNEIEFYKILSEPDLQIRIKEYYDFLKNFSERIKPSYADFFDGDEENFIPTGTCIPFSRRIFLTADGKILPCEKIDHKYYLGEVTYNGVSIDFEEIGAKLNKVLADIKKSCYNCSNLWHCEECMFSFDKKADKYVCKKFTPKSKIKEYYKTIVENISENKAILSKLINDYHEI